MRPDLIIKKIVYLYLCILIFQFFFLCPSSLFANEAKECYDCHQKEKETFAKGTVHPPVEDEGCAVCHRDHGDKNNLVLQFEVEKELCFSCHDEKGVKSYVHNPIREGKCSACHNPHNSINEYFLKDKVPELCLNCHKKNAKERYLHTPYREGKCLGCHSPHESDNRKLLILDSGKKITVVSDLCLECHQKIIQGKNVHLIVLAGECLSCHNPHVSKYKFQLKEPPEKICYQNCHKDFSENRYLHKPVKKGKCISCHDPHSSPNNKLLLPKEFVGDFNFALNGIIVCLLILNFSFVFTGKFLFASCFLTNNLNLLIVSSLCLGKLWLSGKDNSHPLRKYFWYFDLGFTYFPL